jgi:hypothetical protein
MKLIDSYLPDPHAAEFHSIEIDAPPAEVWDVLWSFDLGELLVVKALLGLRTLPKLLFGSRTRRNRRTGFTLADLEAAGFGILGEREHAEVALGVSGRFWSPIHNVDPFDRQAFESPVAEGRARAVWDFALESRDGGGSRLSTETRVFCGDASSRRKFRAYWMLVRPFSGLIRILVLRAIKAECDREPDSTS